MVNKKVVYVIGLALFVILLSLDKKEALLPAGQYNVDAGCTWSTNQGDLTVRYTAYDSPNVWVATDADGDGTWEKYGGASSASKMGGGWVVHIADFNGRGDDMLYDAADSHIAMASNIAGPGYILTEGAGEAPNAIIPSCVDPPVTYDYAYFVGEKNNYLSTGSFDTFISNSNQWVNA